MKEYGEPQDLAPDPALGAALRSLENEPPLQSVDWERLRNSIRARAELPLARARVEGRPGARAARSFRPRLWRPLVPLGAAAAIAAVAVWLAGGDPPQSASVAPPSPEEVFHVDVSEQEFRLLVSGRADPESLLLVALDES